MEKASGKLLSEDRVKIRADAMYRVHELSKQISTYFDLLVSEHGITRAQWQAIMHVSQNPGATQTQLADLMQIGRAAAGKMLDRLEEKGWIERRPDASDNRIRRVYAKTEISPLQLIVPTAALELYEAFYADMTEEQIDDFYATLNRLLASGRAGTERLTKSKR